MKLTIQVPDEIGEQWQSEAARSRVSIAEYLGRQMGRLQGVHYGDRAVVVDPAHRNQLEQLLPGGSLVDGADLVTRIRKLASLEIGSVTIDLSPGQLAELKRKAERSGMTLDQYLHRVWRLQVVPMVLDTLTPAGTLG